MIIPDSNIDYDIVSLMASYNPENRKNKFWILNFCSACVQQAQV